MQEFLENDLRFNNEQKIHYIKFLKEIISELKIQSSNDKFVFSSRNNRLVFQIGQRYCWVLYPAKSGGGFGVISSDNIFSERNPVFFEQFKGGAKPFYSKLGTIFQFSDNERESVFNAMKNELNRTKKSGFSQYNDKDFTSFIFGGSIIETPTNVLNSKFEFQKPTYPLNTIFYGPPGTGKTYNTVLRAAKIIEEREITDYKEALEIFNKNLGDRIEFITFHQNYSYEDFIQGLRPDVENEGSLSFEKKDGVFKRIADRAKENFENSEKKPEEISKSNVFDNALEKFKEFITDSENKVKITDNAYILQIESNAFRYTGENWTLNDKGFSGFRMKFSDLKEFYLNDIQSRKDILKLTNISGLAKQHATYFFNTYQLILACISNNIENKNKIELKNYVIIIDEINRANISRVFGELITLIEPDKRFGGEIPLSSTLPSGDSFIVPSNLYIVGTMNTADKSIALLDIALRRRFEFEPMYPKYEIKGKDIHSVEILKNINKLIISLKPNGGHDFQIGHSYFMGENFDLVNVMNKKVIPLLLEYFMNDIDKVKEILKNAGLSIIKDSWPIEIESKAAQTETVPKVSE